MDVKALLLTREEYDSGDGCGLISIRKYADRFIDFVSIGDYMYDNVTSYIVKDDICYKTHKIYYDMDNSVAVVVCIEDIDPINDYLGSQSDDSESDGGSDDGEGGGGEGGSGFQPGPEIPMP